MMYPATRTSEPTIIEQDISRPLTKYRCAEINPRTLHPCRTVLAEVWSAGEALIRRRCHQCGTWQTIVVMPEG